MPHRNVIVIGAGLAGMLTGAILGRRGCGVQVLEREARPGGRLRSFDVDGFVVDCGAFLWPNHFLDQALAAAGVTEFIGSAIPTDQLLRIYIQGLGGKRFAFPWLGRDAAGLGDTIREVYRISPEQFGALGDLVGKLAQLSEAQTAALLQVSVREWLAQNVADVSIANALVRTLMLFGTWDAPNASIGEFARSLRRNRPGGTPAKAECCGANPGGGVRALVGAIRAALERNGGELRLATTVDEILVANQRAVGVLAHGADPFQQRLPADAIVSNLPIWTVFDLIAARHFPADFVANARTYAKVGGTVGVAYAFNELPTLRETGSPDRFPGWTRLLVGPERSFGGGMIWTSHHSPHNAPPGKHLLQGMRLVPDEMLADHDQVDRIVADFDGFVDEIYGDVQRTLAWRRRWVTRDGTEYMLSAVPRPDVRAPSIANLFFVGETVNLPSVQMDRAAHSALECARLIEEAG
jgi:phytoene dehydrogenase-like protein